MEVFKCRFLRHENEEIIGFCLNQNCQNPTQYCYECLNINHLDHFNDCIRFPRMIQFMNEFREIYNQQMRQFKEMSKHLQNYFEQIQKKMDQEIKKLENMTQQLYNKEYLSFKSQIRIIKEFYSKEKENQIFKISQLNNIINTINNVGPSQSNEDDQFNSGHQINQIEEINNESDDQQLQNIQEAECLIIEGLSLCIYLCCLMVVQCLNQYQEAIEFFDRAIQINPNYDSTWYNKGFALRNKFMMLNGCK